MVDFWRPIRQCASTRRSWWRCYGTAGRVRQYFPFRDDIQVLQTCEGCSAYDHTEYFVLRWSPRRDRQERKVFPIGFSWRPDFAAEARPWNGTVCVVYANKVTYFSDPESGGKPFRGCMWASRVRKYFFSHHLPVFFHLHHWRDSEKQFRRLSHTANTQLHRFWRGIIPVSGAYYIYTLYSLSCRHIGPVQLIDSNKINSLLFEDEEGSRFFVEYGNEIRHFARLPIRKVWENITKLEWIFILTEV